MAATPPLRVEISFDALKEALHKMRDLYALVTADLAVYQAVAEEQQQRLTHLEAEVARLTALVGEDANTPAQPTG